MWNTLHPSRSSLRSRSKRRQPPCARRPSGPGGGRRLPFPQGNLNSQASEAPAAPLHEGGPGGGQGGRATCAGLSHHLLLAALASALMQHQLLLLQEWRHNESLRLRVSQTWLALLRGCYILAVRVCLERDSVYH